MKILKWACFIMLVCGIALLNYTLVVGTKCDWTPVYLPFPGKGFTISWPFYVYKGGPFVLEVDSLVVFNSEKAWMQPHPPVDCNLRVTIDGDRNGFHKDYAITSLRHTGDMNFASMCTYESQEIYLPGGGPYTMKITSNSTVDQFMSNGAMLSLSRHENTVNAIVGDLFLKIIAYTLIGISLFTLLLILILERRT